MRFIKSEQRNIWHNAKLCSNGGTQLSTIEHVWVLSLKYRAEN